MITGRRSRTTCGTPVEPDICPQASIAINADAMCDWRSKDGATGYVMAVSPDGAWLAYNGPSGVVVLHNGTVVPGLAIPGSVDSLAFSSDSTKLYVGRVSPGQIVEYTNNAGSWVATHTFTPQYPATFGYAVAVSADNNTLVGSYGGGDSLQVYKRVLGVWTLQYQQSTIIAFGLGGCGAYTSPHWALALNADGSLLYMGSPELRDTAPAGTLPGVVLKCSVGASAITKLASMYDHFGLGTSCSGSFGTKVALFGDKLYVNGSRNQVDTAQTNALGNVFDADTFAVVRAVTVGLTSGFYTASPTVSNAGTLYLSRTNGFISRSINA